MPAYHLQRWLLKILRTAPGFFAASLPIHQKTCFQRNAGVLVPCDKCRSFVQANSFHAHDATCSGSDGFEPPRGRWTCAM
ncbi:uncharacterized protein IUM83_02651 [Phytophthora cinnamomi]|uniref:uncharacterized protein n=1 Tax=Phytophthora cinnamomi TaxID=4785 RepID=UPI0035593A14|nr:hypothetical protein IUM83_02651 [Phytophthora cinnamomi]